MDAATMPQLAAPMAALLRMSLFLIFACLPPVLAGAQEFVFPNEPQFRLNPAMHTARISRVDIDNRERFAVTASNDKSVLIWDPDSRQLLKRLRLPAAEVEIGRAYAVAISPDGEQIAVGGWTGKSPNNTIYIYQYSSGTIIHKMTGLENVINHLTYSPNGRYLAATLGGTVGLRVYDTTGYSQIYVDRDYQDDSYWVSWQGNNSLVTSSFDSKIRLYSKGISGWALVKHFDTGRKPFGLAVHPDGMHLAVGLFEDTALLLLELPSLKAVAGPPTGMVTNGDVFSVSWSHKGNWLWAGGEYDDNGYSPVLGWRDAQGEPIRFPITTNTVMDIRPLANGDLLVASFDGLTRISAQGDIRWQHVQPLVDFRDQLDDTSIRLSHDGSQVAFGFKQWGAEAAWWDLTQTKLWTDSQRPPPWDGELRGAITESQTMTVRNWRNHYHPTLNGRSLSLQEWEFSRSLAIAPDQQGFLLGTEWYLRRFNLEGQQIWERAVPGAAWAVAISGDGRWLLAGLGDGTLRWYDYRTGKEQLALFPHRNRKDWVSWTPEGFFASSSPAANHLFGYQLNNGSDAPDFIEAEQLYASFYRPDLVLAKFEGRDEPVRQALDQIGDVRQVLQSKPPSLVLTQPVPDHIPGTQLILPLTITNRGGGIGKLSIRVNGVLQSTKAGTRMRQRGLQHGQRGLQHDYKLTVPIPAEATAKVDITASDAKGRVASDVLSFDVRSTTQRRSQKPNLVGLAVGIENYKDSSFKLKYAIDDINAFKGTLREQGRTLYAQVNIDILPDATYDEIVTAFQSVQQRVTEDDVFVLYLSGHGVTDNGNYHYLAQDFVWTSPRALKDKTIDSNYLNTFLAEIKARKAVIILDTCYAGSYKPQLASRDALALLKKSGPEDKHAIHRMMVEQKTAVERLNQVSGRAIFYASTNRDVALEGYNNLSLYTALLLQGLRGEASQDHHISLLELAAYLEHTMPKVSEAHFNVRLYPMAMCQTASRLQPSSRENGAR